MAEFFGKYQLHEKIAQGGMAEVFLASKKGDIGGFTRKVAIKRMFPHLVDRDEIITMFIDEARIASQLHHPNIVQIYDLGVVDGTFFIAMEFVEGYDLRQVCKQGVDSNHFISRPLAVHIVSEVAVGLHYAHTQTDEQGRPMNIVHRDISPQNVLISVDGAVKICDFGIAKAEDRLTQTQIGEFKGKFSYMSPEQFASKGLDCRSDIFALGIVLYETTVGVRLFKARSEFETIRRITEGDFKPPSQIRPNYPRRLEEIILKALDVDPDRRYQSAGAMQEDLEEWLFERRVRIGSRQLASYLDELMGEPSIQTGAGGVGIGSSGEETGSLMESPGQEVAIDPSPARPADDSAPDDVTRDLEAATVELGMSAKRREELLDLRGTQVAPSQDADPTLDDIGAVAPSRQEMAPASGGPYDAFDDSRGARGGSDASETVEVRRITNDEARQRRHDEADDRTLVDEELNETTTSPQDSAPHQVREARRDGNRPSPRSQKSSHSGLKRPGPSSRGNGPPRKSQRPPSGAQPPVAAESSRSQKRPTSGDRSQNQVGADGSDEQQDSVRSTDSLVALVPELKPGGRQLTGLNEVKDPSEEQEEDSDSELPDREPRGRELNRPRDVQKEIDTGAYEQGAPETNTTDVNWRRMGYVAGGFLVVLLLGGIVVALLVGGDDDEPQAEPTDDPGEVVEVTMTAEPVGDREVTLRLDTNPSGAAVVANGVLVSGTTPLNVPLVDGRDNEVWITRRNHRPMRLLIPADGESMSREIDLERASATDGAGVDFVSDPEGAEVYVNGELYGNAPFRMENIGATFETHVQFQLDGHRPFVAFVNFDPDRDNRIEAVMSSADEVAVVGTYDFDPPQSGVYLDGEMLGTTPFEHIHHRDEWLELEVQAQDRQARHHRLRLDHIGGFLMAMELEREARRTGQLSVEVEPAAAVYVDARAFGAAPLEEAELPAGEQRVVFETQDGRRIRVPLTIEADAHKKYRVTIDGDDAEVEELQ